MTERIGGKFVDTAFFGERPENMPDTLEIMPVERTVFLVAHSAQLDSCVYGVIDDPTTPGKTRYQLMAVGYKELMNIVANEASNVPLIHCAMVLDIGTIVARSVSADTLQ